MTTFAIRRATQADRASVLALLRASLGWGDEPRYEALFAWKHDANPFGQSPAWVALDGNQLAGFRTFMRWDFRLDGEIVRAVRAVDTATHPDYQGRGVFRDLTLHAIDELRAEGVAFVFNTPNRASLPGYLRMGWHEVGRLPVRIRPRGIRSLARVTRARVPAARWPVEGHTLPGLPARDVLADQAVVGELRTDLPTAGLHTHRTPAYLAWRYGLDSLGYRALLVGDHPRDGILVFRLRPRSTAVEMAVVDSVGLEASRSPRALIGPVLRECGADYAIAIGPAMPGGRSFPLPHQGPRLVVRGLGREAVLTRSRWDLTLGDVELF